MVTIWFQQWPDQFIVLPMPFVGTRVLKWSWVGFVLATVVACDDGGGADVDAGPTCSFDVTMPVGGAGHAQPLGAAAGQARAGRALATDFPIETSPLVTWKAGDWVLANDRVAIVIEDVGASDLYDPWGGRPIGMSLVAGGKMVAPADFGEFFLLSNRETVVTQNVSVMNDGADGAAAVIRATGYLRPLPFYDAITQPFFRNENPDIPTAIDYVLEPDSNHVDVYFVFRSGRLVPEDVPTIMHGFMYGDRMPRFTPVKGFDESGAVEWLGSIDEDGASFAYSVPGAALAEGIGASGFLAKFTDGYIIQPCSETRRLHARLTIGGPGLDGLVKVVDEESGVVLRAVTGTVTDSFGEPAAGVRVHAQDAADAYLTRALTDAAGAYTLHVPAAAAIKLTAYRRGDLVGAPAELAAGDSARDFQLAPTGLVRVLVRDTATDQPLPARVQIIQAGSVGIPGVPGSFGEPGLSGGRLHVDFAMTGDTTLRVPAGAWKVVVSRGYEYELFEQTVTDVAAGTTVTVNADLERVVDTTGLMCADYHIHTVRSNDSGDDAAEKVRQGVADGLDIPVRSDHEFVEDFQPLIVQLGLDDWALGIASVEMSSMELWGHMGVVPLVPDPDAVNGGAPIWQRFPNENDLSVPLESMRPPEVFAIARARPEQPIVIINHPRGSTNYFGYAGWDAVTGLVARPDDWDEDFTVVEVFNDSSWLGNRDGNVADWLGLLNHGRRVFAVGSSDSHSLSGSPIGYPRTCLEVGTDDPHALTPIMVRDATAGGHASISGGIYVSASIGSAGPGDDVIGAPATVSVRVRVQAASWIDVDAVELVVDGLTVETIAILPGDADPQNPTLRFDRELEINVAPGKGSYVIVAAYGDETLEPVHPGRIPFGVTNPIFLSR